MSEQEVQWGEWRGEGDYRHFWRPLLNTDSFQELTPAYLNTLEREVRELRAYKVLADDIAKRMRTGTFYGHNWQYDWAAKYDALPGTSEGEGK